MTLPEKNNKGQRQLCQKRNYDLRVLQHPYGLGDVVYLRDTSTKVEVNSKLRPPWKGPYLISKVTPQHP